MEAFSDGLLGGAISVILGFLAIILAGLRSLYQKAVKSDELEETTIKAITAANKARDEALEAKEQSLFIREKAITRIEELVSKFTDERKSDREAFLGALRSQHDEFLNALKNLADMVERSNVATDKRLFRIEKALGILDDGHEYEDDYSSE